MRIASEKVEKQEVVLNAEFVDGGNKQRHKEDIHLATKQPELRKNILQ